MKSMTSRQGRTLSAAKNWVQLGAEGMWPRYRRTAREEGSHRKRYSPQRLVLHKVRPQEFELEPTGDRSQQLFYKMMTNI